LLMGGDSPWAFVGSLTLMLGLAGLWFATTCVFWWRREGPGGKVVVILGGYLAALVISSMLTTVGVGVCSFLMMSDFL
jgi:palmitoyltransferase ZDHHC9/14/18